MPLILGKFTCLSLSSDVPSVLKRRFVELQWGVAGAI